MLHGIYGRGRNLRRFAQKLVDAHPAWEVELVDLREHGDSTDRPPPHTVEAAARDVLEPGSVPDLLLGHSFGGKVSLLTLREARDPPDQVWVVDASPSARKPGGLPWEMLGYLRRHPGPFRSRHEGVEVLEAEGVPRKVARWMATNLERRAEDTLAWEISVDAMEALLRSYFREDAWDVVEDPPEGTAIHFVRATDSAVIGDDEARRIRAAGEGADVHLHEVSGGHWLHTDNPEGLLEAMEAHLEGPGGP